MGAKTKLSMREASGALSLVIIILFIQTVIFIIQPVAIKEHSFVKEQIALKKDSLIDNDSPSIGANSDINNDEKRNIFDYNKNVTDNKKHIVDSKAKREKSQLKAVKFRFDPNTITAQNLVELGLTPKQAAVILKYRERGGAFRTKEDFKKIYVLPDGFYDKVKDSIIIAGTKKIDVYKSSAKSNENGGVSSQENGLISTSSSDLAKNNYRDNRAGLSIELNEADSATLLNLPGIGPYYAGKIIAYRERTGGLISANQLMEIRGIDSNRYSMFAHLVFADTLKIAKKDLNEISINELSNNPYIGSYVARAIVRFREIYAKEGITLASLVLNKIIAPELLDKLNHYFN